MIGEPSGLPWTRTCSVPLEVSISCAPSTFRSASLVSLLTAIEFSTSSASTSASRIRTTFTQRLTAGSLRLRVGLRADAELVLALGKRLDDQGDVLVLVHAQLVDPALHLIAIDGCGE